MSKRKTAFRLWALALGEKAGKHEKEADIIALIRTVILFSYIATNVFIVAGVIRHWENKPPTGIEPATSALQKRCSTAELQGQEQGRSALAP